MAAQRRHLLHGFLKVFRLGHAGQHLIRALVAVQNLVVAVNHHHGTAHAVQHPAQGFVAVLRFLQSRLGLCHQLGIGNRQGNGVRHSFGLGEVFGTKCGLLGAPGKVEHAYGLVPIHQGHNQSAGHIGSVPSGHVFGDTVIHNQRLASGDGMTGQAVIHLNNRSQRNLRKGARLGHQAENAITIV